MYGIAWTQEQIKILTDNWGRLTIKDIGERVGRSPVAVKAKATKLGLIPGRESPVAAPDEGADAELAAIGLAYGALAALDRESAARAIAYLCKRLGIGTTPKRDGQIPD